MSRSFHARGASLRSPPMVAARSSYSRLAVRGFVGGFAAAAVAALGYGSLAQAQAIAGFNSNQPVSYAADRIELQDKQKRVVLSGGVVINQGDLRLTAGRTTVAYVGASEVQRIDATGGVVVTRGDERAEGSAGVYDLNRRVIVLAGGVKLRRGTDTLNGGRLTIDLNTGLSSVDGRSGAPGVPGVSGASNGRVSGTFTVPQKH